MSNKRPLTDLSNEELYEWLRAKAQTVEFSYENCYQEIQRRSRDSHASAIKWLTFVIAVTTVISLILSFLKLFQ